MFQPSLRIIESVTTGTITEIKTTQDHLYETGLLVRIVIPEEWGMYQLNNVVGEIVVTGSDTFTLPIYSIGYDSLVAPSYPLALHSYPKVIPMASGSSNQVTRNVLG